MMFQLTYFSIFLKILTYIYIYIYINNFSQANIILKCITCADDTKLLSTLTSFSDNRLDNTIESLINAELSKVDEWININKYH